MPLNRRVAGVVAGFAAGFGFLAYAGVTFNAAIDVAGKWNTANVEKTEAVDDITRLDARVSSLWEPLREAYPDEVPLTPEQYCAKPFDDKGKLTEAVNTAMCSAVRQRAVASEAFGLVAYKENALREVKNSGFNKGIWSGLSGFGALLYTAVAWNLSARSRRPETYEPVKNSLTINCD